MVELPADVIRRIEEKREAAEERLRRTLEPLEKTTDYEKCIPPFVEFAGDLFDAGAKELWRNHAADQEHLEKLLTYVVEGIMAAQGLARARPASEAAGGQKHVWEHATGVQWEEGPDGAKRPVKDPSYGQHGDWERLAPLAVKFLLRLPSIKAVVAQALESALRERMAYWMYRPALPDSDPGHEPTPAPAPEDSAAHEETRRYPHRAAWFNEQLRIRKWTRHKLYTMGGPDRATTRKIQDELPVREDVLERVARGFSQKDPKVKLTDIPQD